MLFGSKNEEINYAPVWEKFKKISSIPRCSGNEEGIINYLIEFAEEHKLEYKKDTIGNLIIYKDPTPGKEQSETLILQAHVDMVCEKDENIKHNFATDPIKVIAEDGWVSAEGTTLGADNGIGVAMILTLLKSNDYPHPRLEALFTVDEERGLSGAFNLEAENLSGRKLINLDTEEDDILYTGSAGGSTTEAIFNLKKERKNGDYVVMNIFVKGLFGGHSGADIHLGRANSIRLGISLLDNLSEVCDYYLYDITGGTKRNVIPRELNMELYFEPDLYYKHEKRIEKEIARFKRRSKRQHRKSDPDLDIIFSIVEKNNPEGVMLTPQNTVRTIVKAILSLPHGPSSYNRDYNVVELSSNLAIINHQNDSIFIVLSQRSSDEKKLSRIVKRINRLLSKAGAKVVTHSEYPAWHPVEKSSYVKEIAEIYKKTFNSKPKVSIIHAGLECGVIGTKIENLEMISFGPRILNVHTTKEKVSIKSVEKIYRFLLKVVEQL